MTRNDQMIRRWNKATDKAVAKAKARLIEIGSELNRIANCSRKGDTKLAHALQDERNAIYGCYPSLKNPGRPLIEVLD